VSKNLHFQRAKSKACKGERGRFGRLRGSPKKVGAEKVKKRRKITRVKRETYVLIYGLT